MHVEYIFEHGTREKASKWALSLEYFAANTLNLQKRIFWPLGGRVLHRFSIAFIKPKQLVETHYEAL